MTSYIIQFNEEKAELIKTLSSDKDTVLENITQMWQKKIDQV